ncbi:CDP-alcohol phosphatidyltransferase family protein [Dongshaea marina]|uniref:CDP-alcohol phosphatidyltransferase family protein n=1 Tax=Dongshaea marina TaxID=2047966 RepID=UPI000D3EAD74|nr:CDP-alcohol phosphatidyltransferase family protein [Dongshaea marina]
MLDRYSSRLIHYPLLLLTKPLSYTRITPNQLTLSGFIIGMLTIPLLGFKLYLPALGCIVLNRIIDGLDGAWARRSQQKSDRGGFLDIVLDFIFYAGVVFGFALANPAHNALAAAFLIFCFMGTASSFLAFAIMAERRGIPQPNTSKSLFYLGGLTEGTETILFFIAFCLWPAYFPYLAGVFGLLCLCTTYARIRIGSNLL